MSKHSHHSHQNVGGRGLKISIVLNLLITAGQFVAGLISGSLALLSDALHNLTDVVALLISFVAQKLYGLNRTSEKTFGYKRAEVVAAFVNAGILTVVGIQLISNAVSRLWEPQPIQAEMVIWFSLLGILVNGLSAVLLQQGAKQSLNLRSAYLHLMADMLTSFAVLASGIIIYYTGFLYADALLTLVIAGYLLYMSVRVLKKTFGLLMLFTPKHINIYEVSRKIAALPHVRNIHQVHIWQLDEHSIHFEAHLDLEKNMPVSEYEPIHDKVEELLLNEYGINHCTIQPEVKRKDCKSLVTY